MLHKMGVLSTCRMATTGQRIGAHGLTARIGLKDHEDRRMTHSKGDAPEADAVPKTRLKATPGVCLRQHPGPNVQEPPDKGKTALDHVPSVTIEAMSASPLSPPGLRGSCPFKPQASALTVLPPQQQCSIFAGEIGHEPSPIQKVVPQGPPMPWNLGGKQQKDTQDGSSVNTEHVLGTCKPCVFEYRGVCRKPACTFCHFGHSASEIRRVHPSKSTRRCLRRRTRQWAEENAGAEVVSL